jgi:hypothetical protein
MNTTHGVQYRAIGNEMFSYPPAQVSLTQVAICRVSRSILFPFSLAAVPSIWTALGRDYYCRGSAQERLAAVAWEVFLLAAGVAKSRTPVGGPAVQLYEVEYR